MRRKVLSTRNLAISISMIISVISCKEKAEQLQSPPGYDFAAMEKSDLDDKLREVSGIAWDHIKNEFAVVKDERGRVYFLDKETKAIREQLDFSDKGDYEDIVYVKSVPYLLRSDGFLFRCNMDSTGAVSGTEMGHLALEGKVDFESIYYDSTRNSLIIICKNCEMDEKKKVSAFAFNLESNSFSSTPVYRIDVDTVKKLAPKESSRFQPSGAAFHPIQKKVYILSSASNQLVVIDPDGNVEKVYVLAANYFPQPEGITIKNNGDMYITNEGKTGKASLLRFAFRKR